MTFGPPERRLRQEGEIEAVLQVSRWMRRAAIAALWFFLAANIFDMNGRIGWKYVSYFTALPFVFVGVYLGAARPLHNLIYVVLFLMWPFFCFANGIMHGAQPEVALSQTTPFSGFAFGLYMAPIIGTRRALEMLFGMLTLAAGIAIASNLSLRFGVLLPIPDLAHEYISSDDAPLLERYYMSATLWFVPCAIFYSVTERYVLMMISLLALFLSLSKAGVLIAGVSILGYFGLRGRRFRGVAAVLLVLWFGALMVPDYRDRLNELFFGESTSRQVRVDDAKGVAENVGAAPFALLIGRGAGVPFYSAGQQGEVVRIEFDHADALLKYGAPWFICFTWLCGLSAWLLFQTGHRKLVGFAMGLIGMYIASGTNPHLTSPLFMFFSSCCFSMAMYNRAIVKTRI